MRKILLSLLFFVLTPVTIFSSIFLLSSKAYQTSVLGAATSAPALPYAFAALPTSENIFEGSATLADKRPESLSLFLSSYNSPLAPYAKEMVSKADEYGIDYRLLPAIAMQETTLCRKTLPQAPYNCWGYGVWGKRVTGFSSFDIAIDTISKYFGNRKARGIATLDEIATIYNPGNTNHWKENVAYFMQQL